MRWNPLPFALSLVIAAGSGLAADAALRPERLRQAMGLKLGNWHSRSSVVEVRVDPGPGVDPADTKRAAAAIRAKLGEHPGQDQCLWDDGERMYLPGLRPMPGCDFSRVEARKGRFALNALCKARNSNAPVEIAVAGRYAPKSMTARSEVATTMNGVRVRIKLDTESRFTGKCAAIPVIMTPAPKAG